MSRMSDMAQTIEELRSAAAVISDAADWLTKMFSSEPQAEDAPASPPEPELTLEQVRAVLADKSRQGHTAEIRALLQKYGASKLSQIDPAHYKAARRSGGDDGWQLSTQSYPLLLQSVGSTVRPPQGCVKPTRIREATTPPRGRTLTHSVSFG